MRQHDRARWFPLVAPELPLLRASVRRNLSLRRTDLENAALTRAIRTVGLDPDRWRPEVLIDEASPHCDAWIKARLRLARAIAHRPKVIFLAEPALASAPDYQRLVESVAAATGANIVAFHPQPPPAYSSAASLRNSAAVSDPYFNG